ncbi:hypothetical protein [Solidesulfovibrio sp.]|uniref:hypothetical protein n=1 Tax=Solidesulfovibrio sp. TaxID=2910990 RepID=UPI002637AA77|nr:hypothetical protein [Solidesulfovibrio sp.]
MLQETPSQIVEFITWKTSYDCVVDIINCQHKGILRFINAWHTEILNNRIPRVNSIEYMRNKFSFLEIFSYAHFTLEEGLLKILVDRFGFKESVYTGHLTTHAKFVNNFMNPLKAQVEMTGNKDLAIVDHIAADALGDVAKWWYNHIRDVSENSRCSYDHYYRLFIERLSETDKITMFNDVIMFLEKCPQPYSCTTW